MTRLLKLSAPLFALTAMLALVAGTHATDKPTNADVTLEGVTLGTHVHGPKVAADDLSGKVVVFEYWGDRCPPCIRAIPHLAEIRSEYSTDKLAMVANQVWTKDVEAAKKAWSKAGGGDDISVVNHGAIKGAKVRGVPNAFVFDHNGKLLWQGHPMDKTFDKTIKNAVAKLPSQS